MGSKLNGQTTKNNRKGINHPRVLAIDTSSSGFGFSVFEGPQRLVDWGECNSILHRLSKANDRFEKLLMYYSPDILILENTNSPEYRGGKRATMIINMLMRRCAIFGLVVRRYTRDEIRLLFKEFEAVTKQEIAEHIVDWLPELKPIVPTRKPIWETPDRNMRIFNSASLAFTYYAEFEEEANKV